jgi:aromatase
MSGHTDNSILIAADIDYVWTLTNDLEQWPQLFTEYASVEILDRHDNTVRFRLTMRPNPDGVAWSWVSQRTLDEAAHRVTASRIELGWFERMDIEWTYEAEDGGTRMRWVQDFHMKPTAPNDDKGAEDYLNKNTKVQMGVIKERLEAEAAKSQ